MPQTCVEWSKPPVASLADAVAKANNDAVRQAAKRKRNYAGVLVAHGTASRKCCASLQVSLDWSSGHQREWLVHIRQWNFASFMRSDTFVICVQLLTADGLQLKQEADHSGRQYDNQGVPPEHAVGKRNRIVSCWGCACSLCVAARWQAIGSLCTHAAIMMAGCSCQTISNYIMCWQSCAHPVTTRVAIGCVNR